MKPTKPSDLIGAGLPMTEQDVKEIVECIRLELKEMPVTAKTIFQLIDVASKHRADFAAFLKTQNTQAK